MKHLAGDQPAASPRVALPNLRAETGNARIRAPQTSKSAVSQVSEPADRLNGFVNEFAEIERQADFQNRMFSRSLNFFAELRLLIWKSAVQQVGNLRYDTVLCKCPDR